MCLVAFALVATGVQYGIGVARLTKRPREWLAVGVALLIGIASLPVRIWRALNNETPETFPAYLDRVSASVLRFLACAKCSGLWIGIALHLGGLSPGFAPFGRVAWLAAGLSAAVLVSVLRSHMDLSATTEET